MNAITAWLYSLMVLVAPPAELSALPAFPGWAETAPEREVRYQAIAEAIYTVTYEAGGPSLYRGPRGRAKTAATLLAIAFMESRFAKDVDIGPCYRGKDGRSSRCDGGQSGCMMQRKIGRGMTPEGYTQADLFADREKCFRSGLNHARRSFRSCFRQGHLYLLNAYASGGCDRGQSSSKARMALADRLFSRVRPEPDALFLWVQQPPPEAPPELPETPPEPRFAPPPQEPQAVLD